MIPPQLVIVVIMETVGHVFIVTAHQMKPWRAHNGNSPLPTSWITVTSLKSNTCFVQMQYLYLEPTGWGF